MFNQHVITGSSSGVTDFSLVMFFDQSICLKGTYYAPIYNM